MKIKPVGQHAKPLSDSDEINLWNAILENQNKVAVAARKEVLPEADDFMREFAPSFMLPLDALN